MERSKICILSTEDQSHIVNIEVFDRQADLPLIESSILSLVREVFAFLDIETDEILLHFVSKENLCQLHKVYFDDPSPTDCITFPIDPPGKGTDKNPSVLGEIYISPHAAKEYDSENPYQELSLYIIHGILHLIGYDDIEEKDRTKMREAEAKVMSHLDEKKLLLAKPQSSMT